MRFPTLWYVRPAKPQINLRIAQSDQSLCKWLEHSMTVRLLPEQHLEFLSLNGGCTGSSEFTLVKIPHCWKPQVMAHMDLVSVCNNFIIYISVEGFAMY